MWESRWPGCAGWNRHAADKRYKASIRLQLAVTGECLVAWERCMLLLVLEPGQSCMLSAGVRNS
jgi:hypothetical protein